SPLKQSNDGATVSARFSERDLDRVEQIVDDLKRKLDVIAKERLTPRMVEEILGITSKERSRWTKDGRLPKSGTSSFKRGRQKIQLSTHPPDKIAALAIHPEVIEAWRTNDGKK